MIRIPGAALAAVTLAGTAMAEPVNLQPGKWQADMSMTVLGQTMNDSMTDCMGAEEANMEATALAQEFAGGANCTASNVQSGPGTVTFDLSCPGEAMSAAKVTLTFQSTSFVLVGDVTLDFGNGQTAPGTLRADAKYLGACDIY